VLFSLLVYAESAFGDLAGLVFIGIGAAAIMLGSQPNGLAGLLLDSLERLRAWGRTITGDGELRVVPRFAAGPPAIATAAGDGDGDAR
jgi:hypothetical protein